MTILFGFRPLSCTYMFRLEKHDRSLAVSLILRKKLHNISQKLNLNISHSMMRKYIISKSQFPFTQITFASQCSFPTLDRIQLWKILCQVFATYLTGNFVCLEVCSKRCSKELSMQGNQLLSHIETCSLTSRPIVHTTQEKRQENRGEKRGGGKYNISWIS